MRQFFVAARHALEGIVRTWRQERNFRFQTIAGLVVVAAAYALDFDYLRWAVLLVVIALVLAGELLNTAIEEMGDEAGVSETVGRSKDAAAGAVLVLALMAVGVGVALFWEPILKAWG